MKVIADPIVAQSDGIVIYDGNSIMALNATQIADPDDVAYLEIVEAKSELANVFPNTMYTLSLAANTQNLKPAGAEAVAKIVQYNAEKNQVGQTFEVRVDAGLNWHKRILSFNTHQYASRIHVILTHEYIDDPESPTSICHDANGDAYCDLTGVSYYDEIFVRPVLQYQDPMSSIGSVIKNLIYNSGFEQNVDSTPNCDTDGDFIPDVDCVPDSWDFAGVVVGEHNETAGVGGSAAVRTLATAGNAMYQRTGWIELSPNTTYTVSADIMMPTSHLSPRSLFTVYAANTGCEDWIINPPADNEGCPATLTDPASSTNANLTIITDAYGEDTIAQLEVDEADLLPEGTYHHVWGSFNSNNATKVMFTFGADPDLGGPNAFTFPFVATDGHWFDNVSIRL